jgi:hypothetical protein
VVKKSPYKLQSKYPNKHYVQVHRNAFGEKVVEIKPAARPGDACFESRHVKGDKP